MPPRIGMLRIRYPNNPMVFEFRRMNYRDVEEQLLAHATRFPSGAVHAAPASQLVTEFTRSDYEKVLNDHSAMIAEWIDDEGKPSQKITRVRLPAALQKRK